MADTRISANKDVNDAERVKSPSSTDNKLTFHVISAILVVSVLLLVGLTFHPGHRSVSEGYDQLGVREIKRVIPVPVEPGLGTGRANLATQRTILPACSWGNITDSSRLFLLRGGQVYDPAPRGQMDLLIGGGKILRMLEAQSDEAINLANTGGVQIVDVPELLLTPGLVDIHVHVTGGGGEAGPGSDVPVARLSEMVLGGLSTVVGVLGTDSITRSVESLSKTVAGLDKAPITAFMYTGAYRAVPSSPTITGTVMKDIALLDRVVGVGEVAVSDFRGSQPTAQQLATLASDAQVGGLLGGKGGILYCHMGSNHQVLDDLFEAVKISGVAFTQIIPTHVGRTPELAKAAARWLAAGGYADVTADTKAPSVVDGFLKQQLPMERITVSSDVKPFPVSGEPKFDAQKRLVGYDYARPNRLLQFLNSMLGLGYNLESVLPLVTRNPATALKLPNGKGTLVEGGDADIAILSLQAKRLVQIVGPGKQDQLQLKYLFNKGILAKSPDCVAKGMFEDSQS